MTRNDKEPLCRDYSAWITLRVFLIIVLWVWYGLTPYTIPLQSLWIVTVTMLLYTFLLYSWNYHTMGLLMLIAAGLNALMIPYFGKQLNLILSLAITVILFWDIVTTQQQCGAE